MENSTNTSDVKPLAASLCPKVKQIIGRRAKTTERRKASTKRWAARKKALLAATGENDTDSDSMSSDDPQLSPVQKARAKCNAEKVAESQRRMAKALKNLDSNLDGCYGTNGDSDSYLVGDTDSERAKCNDTEKIAPTPTNGSEQVRLLPNDSTKNDGKVMKNSISSTVECRKNSSSITDDFLPHSVRSELIVDDATFIVTSTLTLSDPHYTNNSQSTIPLDDTNHERNTDIIDAVQLRRVSPKSQEKRDKKFVESCLNIEVEGTELDALQRVQTDLAKFVEKDMRIKFSRDNQDRKDEDSAATTEFRPTLDNQLKTIVEKAIKKNLDNTRNSANNRGNNTFTSEFVRAAMRSKIFQPRVLLIRLDVTKMLENEKKTPRTRAKSKVVEKNSDPLSITRAKRRCVQPIKYADYETSPIEESGDGDLVDDEPKISSPGPKSSKVKTYGPASAKQILPTVNKRESQKNKIASTQQSKNSLLRAESSPKVSSLTSENTTKMSHSEIDESMAEKHICGMCGDTFGTPREVEIHFATHGNSNATNKQSKQKMMRCKRCHEIVDARYVKHHVCLALRSLHKCYSCNSSFKTEKMLARHVASHSLDDRDGKIVPNVIVKEKPKGKIKSERIVDEAETDELKNENSGSNLQLPGVITRESYTCFVCDKTFTDEEILKDHLQKHCDDMSDDQRSTGKDYQCAICGDSLDSEDALETHVEKHLFDDEDDNPNLISIGGNNDSPKMTVTETARCGQCAEEFDSEMLLMLHMQAHDEEAAIAEWERRGIDSSQHVCVICDDVFATEIELSDHLDVHNGNAHICQLCDKPFLTLEELQCHVNTH